MEFNEKQKVAQQVMTDVIVKCWEDENFKNELITNPVETLEKFTGNPINIPEGKTLVVRDDSNKDNTTNITG